MSDRSFNVSGVWVDICLLKNKSYKIYLHINRVKIQLTWELYKLEVLVIGLWKLLKKYRQVKCLENYECKEGISDKLKKILS